MRNLTIISLIGILLCMIAITPVIATLAAGNQGTSYGHAFLQSYTTKGNYVSYTAWGHSSPTTLVGSSVKNSYSHYQSSMKPLAINVRTFTDTDNGKTYTVTRNQVVKIQINENPTTGYQWEPSVSSGIQIIDDSYQASTSGRMGAGGIRTWTLKMTAAGDQEFNANYKRPWESGSEDTYTINFVVA
jgi:predicted secreted protein